MTRLLVPFVLYSIILRTAIKLCVLKVRVKNGNDIAIKNTFLCHITIMTTTKIVNLKKKIKKM